MKDPRIEQLENEKEYLKNVQARIFLEARRSSTRWGVLSSLCDAAINSIDTISKINESYGCSLILYKQ